MIPREQAEPVEGYEAFFGLNEAPFSLAPDPRFLFASPSHSAALAQVAYAIQRREPLVVVTGEIGTGKTLLCRTVLQRLPGKTFLSVIGDPLLDRDELLKQMLQDFGVISKDRTRLAATSRHELVEALHAFLSSLAPIHAHAVVIIDEAQHLQPDVLEQIRLLSNVDDTRGTAFGIVLVGQTDLEQLLARPELRQLQQRVSRSLRLEPLNREEVQQYIEHRLSLARGNDEVPGASGADSAEVDNDFAWDLLESVVSKPGVEFTTDAFDAVSQVSGGVPRVINLLCDRALEKAHASRLKVIDRRMIHAAARALGIGESVVPFAPAGLHLAARRTREEEEEQEAEPVETFTRAEPLTEAEPEPQAVETVPPIFSTPAGRTARPGLWKYAVLAVLIVAAGAAILWGTRTRPAAGAPGSSSPVTSTTNRPSGAQPEPPAPDAAALSQKPAAGSGTPTPSTPGVPTAGGEQFELIVASFRTDARATAVAAEIEALGLPNRRRESDGWQQVICGPFATRADAEAAHQQLESAGLTGAQMVPVAR